VVEADRDTGTLLAERLIADGYSVDVARSASHARLLARTGGPDALLLGALETTRAPLDLLEEVRSASPGSAWSPRVPTIVLGAGGRNELALVRSFEAGADDFLPRPMRYVELRLRLRALLVRGADGQPGGSLLAVGPLRIDLRTRRAVLQEQPVELRRREFDLLVRLAREPRRVFARQQLLAEVWGYRATVTTRTVDSHASRLRRKLEAVQACRDPGATTRWVAAVRGVGYRLT
jgi:DNA-binding response OmpR family regulator